MPAKNQDRPGSAVVSTSTSLTGGVRLAIGSVAVAAQGGVVFPDLLQGDGQVRDEDDVVVAEDHLDLGAGAVEAERPAGFGRDGDGAVAGLDGDEPQAPLHGIEDTRYPVFYGIRTPRSLFHEVMGGLPRGPGRLPGQMRGHAKGGR
jgi:hypothetical protein